MPPEPSEGRERLDVESYFSCKQTNKLFTSFENGILTIRHSNYRKYLLFSIVGGSTGINYYGIMSSLGRSIR